MTDSPSCPATFAVVPVLVGPLQMLLALLPAILLGMGSLLLAAFKPAGFKMLVRFSWRQKYFFACLGAIGFGAHRGFWLGHLRSDARSLAAGMESVTDWPAFRGGATRLGRGPGLLDPTAPTRVWNQASDQTIYSSPAISGNRLIYSTVSSIGPFSPQGKGAIVCVDVHTGDELWRYAPSDYRATFSSPVVRDGYVVCGEGLHLVQDARISCLDMNGALVWQFRTKSHVESTACIDGGRVFVGAGDDGFYCLDLAPAQPPATGATRVVWHLDAAKFPDCESSPIVADGVLYFGLGEGGHAVCAVDAATGELRWKIDTPYPVFAPPTIAAGKLFVAMGNGNFIQSASDLLEMRLQSLRDDGATEAELAAAREQLRPVGEVWCIDLGTQAVEWKFPVGDAILGAVACQGESLYFGSRDKYLYCVSTTGQLRNRFLANEPIVSSPALGDRHLYFTDASGRLYCLATDAWRPIWDVLLGTGEGFFSSPAVAHGHVFVGTPQDGLRCIGTPLPPVPSTWAQGARGGAADDEPVPEQLAVAWRFPQDKTAPFLATAPLMPLDGAVYVAGRRGDAYELVKLDASPTADLASRQKWTRQFNQPICSPPSGCGERLFVIESAGTNDSLPPILHCLSADDGDFLWSHGPMSDSPVGMTPAGDRLFLWMSPNQLVCLDAGRGKVLWEASRGNGIGAPAVADNIVIGATTGGLTAWDAPTGAELWHVKLDEPPRGGPIIDGHQLWLPFDARWGRFFLSDGRLGEFGPLPALIARPNQERDVPGVGRPVTPFVTMKGRVYVANDSGEVLCLAEEQP